MALLRYLIADLRVEMEVTGELLAQRSEKYRCDFEGTPDIVIAPEPHKMDKFRENHPSLTKAQAEYLGTGSIFYFNLLNFGGFMLHSSCIEYNGKAYIFSADSGTGKSTHTSLWQKYIDGVTMINDDKPAMKLVNGVFHAMGTPWSGKNDDNCNISVPVGGVALLKRGTQNKIYPATAAETVPFFMRQTVFPVTADSVDRYSELLDRFILSTPIYHLECDMSEDAVITSFEKLTNQKYIKRK